MLHEVPSFWGRYRANFCHQPPWQVLYPCHLWFKLSPSFLAVFGSLYMHHYFHEMLQTQSKCHRSFDTQTDRGKLPFIMNEPFGNQYLLYSAGHFLLTNLLLDTMKLRQRSVEKKAELWSLHRWHILWPIETMTLNTLTNPKRYFRNI